MSEHTFGPDQHRYLPAAPPADEGTLKVRRQLAKRAHTTDDCVYVGHDGDAVLGRILQALIRPGDRVALALPTAAEHTRQSLAVGAAYVDVGCDQRFVPRSDRLARLTSDGAVAVVLATRPNPLSGVEWLPDVPGDVWLVDDQRAATTPTFEPLLPGSRRVSVHRSGAVTWVIAAPEVVERLRRLAPEPPSSLDQLDTASEAGPKSARPGPDWSLLDALGLVTSASTSEWALVRRQGHPASDLMASCAAAELKTSPPSDHHTWRDAVHLRWPGQAGLSRLATVLATSALLLGAACGDKSAASAEQKKAPAQTTPAPAAKRPAPAKASSDPPPPVAKKNLHRTPVVGGCGTLCTDARSAVTGFAAALVASDRSTRLPLYIDSSQLVLDGDNVGERLGQMWLKGQHSPRLQALGQIVDDLGAQTKGADEAALLAAAEQAAFKEQLPRRAVMELALPPKNVTWTITVGRRGLEWLVTGIRTR